MTPDEKRKTLRKHLALARHGLASGEDSHVWQDEVDRIESELASLQAQDAAAVAPPSPKAPPPPPPPPPTTQTAYATPALSNEDALPFKPGQAQPPPAAADEAPHEDAGETAFMPPLDIDDDVLPFDADAPELTVEQYASLCVERTLSPGEESEVASRYQVLTEQALRSLDERFRQRFAAEGELLHRYQQAYARYEAWLRNQAKK